MAGPVIAGATIIAATVAVQAVSSLAQYFQQEKARNAAKSELDQIKAAYDAIVPPQFDAKITDPPDLIAEAAAVVDFDWTKITPEQYKVIGKYTPEIAPYIAEQNPQIVADTSVGQKGLESQLAALRQLKQVAEGGIDPQFAQRMREASQSAQSAAQSRSESILQDYQRRGLLGSGTQLAAELSGAEGDTQRAAQMSGDAATQSYLNQLGALRDSADLGGQIRGAELDIASKNAEIANAFNQRTSQAYQKYLENAADQRNQAAIDNLAAAQKIDNANVESRNKAEIRERNREDTLKKEVRNQEIENAQLKNAVARQGWMDKLSQQEAQNKIKQAQFGNQMDILQGKQGIGRSKADLDIRTGQARAQAIGGLGDAAQSGITYAGQKQLDDKAFGRQAAIDKVKYGVEYDDATGAYKHVQKGLYERALDRDRDLDEDDENYTY